MTQKNSKLVLSLLLITVILAGTTLTAFFVGYKFSSHRSSEFALEKQNTYQTNRTALEDTLSVKGRTVFIGDSLIASAPWNELFPYLNISIRAFDGLTTAQIIPFVNAVSTQKPSSVIIMAGINDVYTKVSPETTCENLNHMAKTLQDSKIHTLIILPFPSIKYGKIHLSDGAKDIASCMKSKTLAKQITLIDLTDVMTDGNKMKPEYTYDGVHLTSDGYQEWAKHIEKFFRN